MVSGHLGGLVYSSGEASSRPFVDIDPSDYGKSKKLYWRLLNICRRYWSLAPLHKRPRTHPHDEWETLRASRSSMGLSHKRHLKVCFLGEVVSRRYRLLLLRLTFSWSSAILSEDKIQIFNAKKALVSSHGQSHCYSSRCNAVIEAFEVVG